jgi:hypothetical protein
MMVGMKLGQFTLKRSLGAMALISVGFLGLSMWLPGRLDFTQWDPLTIFYIACACTCIVWLGAGIGLLFGRMDAGIILGFFAQLYCFILTR